MFDRCGLHFREVENRDLELLRDHRNKFWQGYRDPTPVMTMHNQDAWMLTLNAQNWALIVEDPTIVFHDYHRCALVANYIEPDIAKVAKCTCGAKSAVIGLLRISNFDLQNRSADITGVDVFLGHTGRGYANRICRAAAEYLIHDLGYHRVKGECVPSNIAMKKALECAGFTMEGMQRERIWRCGEWKDFLQYSILAGELWPEDAAHPPHGL